MAGHRRGGLPVSWLVLRSRRRAPGGAGMDGGQPEDLDLVELPFATWRGWVFVNATGQPPGSERYLGALEGIVAAYCAEDLVVMCPDRSRAPVRATHGEDDNGQCRVEPVALRHVPRAGAASCVGVRCRTSNRDHAR